MSMTLLAIALVSAATPLAQAKWRIPEEARELERAGQYEKAALKVNYEWIQCFGYVQQDTRYDETVCLPLEFERDRLFIASGESEFILDYTSETKDKAEKLLPKDHPDLSLAYTSYAIALRRSGRLAEAGMYYREAVRIGELHPDKTDPGILYLNLGVFLETTGEFDEAETIYRRAVAIFEEKYSFAALGNAYSNLGALLTARGDLVEGKRYLLRAMRIFPAWGGKSNPRYLQAASHYAEALRLEGKDQEAYDWLKEISGIADAALSERSRARHAITNQLALAAMRLGRLEEAKSAFQRSLELRRQYLAPDNPELTRAMANFGRFLVITKQEIPLARRYLKEAADATIRRVEASTGFDELAAQDLSENRSTFVAQVKAAYLLAR